LGLLRDIFLISMKEEPFKKDILVLNEGILLILRYSKCLGKLWSSLFEDAD
jgi:hypothetical protein